MSFIQNEEGKSDEAAEQIRGDCEECDQVSLPLGIPESTILVTLTAIGLGFMSNVATRLLVDLKKERRLRAETAAFDKELRQAIQKKDKEKEEKLKKKKPQMDQMKLKASTGRFKVLIVTWLPFIARLLLHGWSSSEVLSICVAVAPLAASHPVHRLQRDHGPDLVVLPLVPLVLYPAEQAPGHLPT